MANRLVSTLIASLGISVSAFAADAAYEVSVKDVVAQVLFDQQIEQSALVTVKPLAFNDAEGDTAALEQCLWSVLVTLESGQVSFSPGKMICIGPSQEVLEAIPSGDIQMQGQCDDSTCSSYTVLADSTVTMQFTAPIELTKQPRNER